MAHLIDKDAVIAEIKELQSKLNLDSPFGIGGYTNLSTILDRIDTLEVKEVDLDFTKEVNMWLRDNEDTSGFFNVQKLAKHFFELGLKAKEK